MSRSSVREWAAAMRGEETKPALRMRDHPRIQELERVLLIYSAHGRANPPHVDDLIDDVSREIFAIKRNETEFVEPAPLVWDDDILDDLSPGRAAAEIFRREREEFLYREKLFAKHEARFGPADASPEELLPVLKRAGLDFSDPMGQPLRCTKHLARQAIAAAKKIMGRMPDASAFSTASFEKNLMSDAEEWLAAKRKKRQQ